MYCRSFIRDAGLPHCACRRINERNLFLAKSFDSIVSRTPPVVLSREQP